MASRGGRSLTSTKLPVIGGSVQYKGGLHRPPFLFPQQPIIPLGYARGSPFRSQRLQDQYLTSGKEVEATEKSERPVGVPAALAWGMEGLHSEAQSFSEWAGCSTALASRRTTHRSKIAMIIPPTPETGLTFRLLRRFCRTGEGASLGN